MLPERAIAPIAWATKVPSWSLRQVMLEWTIGRDAREHHVGVFCISVQDDRLHEP